MRKEKQHEQIQGIIDALESMPHVKTVYLKDLGGRIEYHINKRDGYEAVPVELLHEFLTDAEKDESVVVSSPEDGKGEQLPAFDGTEKVADANALTDAEKDEKKKTAKADKK